MNIKQLPLPTRAKLRSTQILSSLPQIVSELLQNALDAEAQHVDVGVDCEEWACWVRDDGVGISKDALSVIGGGSDSGRYSTSKPCADNTINALETFGFRGEALASIGNLSCLEICSRTGRSRDTWSVIVKGEKNLYNGSAVRWRRESSGTTVHVRDAFYNLPVRRRSHPPPVRVLEQIRHELESYALVFPNISFSLQNLQNQRRPGSSKDGTWRVPKTGSTLAAFRHLFGKSLVKRVEEMSTVFGNLKLDGFISLVGAPSKMYQFLYVNRHLISQCDLHKAVDSVFAKSTFHKNAPEDEDDTEIPASVTRRSPRKSEKKPVYVLNLSLPPETIDNCLEPDKTAIHIRDMETVASFLASIIRGFLQNHGYVTEVTCEEAAERRLESPRKKRRIQKIHSEEINDSAGYSNNLTDIGHHSSTAPPPCIDLNNDAEYQRWTDSRTGQTFVINSRTGNTCNAAIIREQTIDSCLHDRREERRTLSLRGPATESNRATTPDWLKDALKNNSVYVATSNVIPFVNRFDSCETCPRRGGRQIESAGPVCRFVKSDLEQAKVIGQVDPGELLDGGKNKIDTLGDSSLVLIDQHAADERICVERYLKELCQGFLHNRRYGPDSEQGVRVQTLEPPIPLLLTRHEALILASSRDLQKFLCWWGLHLTGLSTEMNGTEAGSESGNNHGYFQVLVKSLPLIISDKLMAKDELRNLVKSILGCSDIVGLSNQEPEECVDQPLGELSWLNGLRCCPQGILDLINSKACRGAIMFNDGLTLEQCKKLVYQLSETVFPFQCAHGRPSLVPVTNIDILRPRRREVTRLGWSRLGQ